MFLENLGKAAGTTLNVRMEVSIRLFVFLENLGKAAVAPINGLVNPINGRGAVVGAEQDDYNNDDETASDDGDEEEEEGEEEALSGDEGEDYEGSEENAGEFVLVCIELGLRQFFNTATNDNATNWKYQGFCDAHKIKKNACCSKSNGVSTQFLVVIRQAIFGLKNGVKVSFVVCVLNSFV